MNTTKPEIAKLPTLEKLYQLPNGDWISLGDVNAITLKPLNPACEGRGHPVFIWMRLGSVIMDLPDRDSQIEWAAKLAAEVNRSRA